MAVQQNRKTPSKRDKRRTHDALGYSTISTDRSSGTRHLRHHVADDGFYRGRQTNVVKQDDDNEDYFADEE